MQWHTLNRKNAFFLLVLVLGTACERITVEPDTARFGYDYYPLAHGQYRIYDVYRINYNFAAENDTLEYEVKEWISETYLNQEGDTTYVLQRLSRAGEEPYWALDSVYLIRRTSYQAIELNNNRPVVKLVFPVEEGKSWNSNQLNTIEAENFKMVEVHKPYQLNDTVFQSTLTVMQRNIQDTIVRQDVRKEVYGLHLGPVYRVVRNLNYCSSPDCIGMGIVNSGVYEEMKLKEFGKE